MTDVSSPATEPQGGEPAVESLAHDVRAKILFLLETYPFISRSMIQVGLSPALPPKLWDPILQSLVTEGSVIYVEVQATNPGNRTLVKGVYHLPKYQYPPETQLTMAEIATLRIT